MMNGIVQYIRRKKFITFGSHDNYIEAGKRLVKQVESLDIFTESILYTPEYLEREGFQKQHSEFLRCNTRGYGFWLWKPFIINKTMETMDDGDILLYLDAGCEVGCEKKDKLLKCIDIVKTDKIIGAKEWVLNEKHFNKMDLIEHMDVKYDKYLNTIQREAGIILFLVCKETRDLVNEWYNLGCNYHNIDNSPSISKNFDSFI